MARALSAEGKTCGAAGSGSHIGRGVRTEGAAWSGTPLAEVEGVSGRPEAPGLPGLRPPAPPPPRLAG